MYVAASKSKKLSLAWVPFTGRIRAPSKQRKKGRGGKLTPGQLNANAEAGQLPQLFENHEASEKHLLKLGLVLAALGVLNVAFYAFSPWFHQGGLFPEAHKWYLSVLATRNPYAASASLLICLFVLVLNHFMTFLGAPLFSEESIEDEERRYG